MASTIWQYAEDAFLNWRCSDADFSCAYCGALYQSEGALIQHVSTVHKLEFEKYSKDNPHFRVARVEKRCELCGSPERNLSLHLDETHHKMAPEAYFMRFVFQEISAVGANYSGVGEMDNCVENDGAVNCFKTFKEEQERNRSKTAARLYSSDLLEKWR